MKWTNWTLSESLPNDNDYDALGQKENIELNGIFIMGRFLLSFLGTTKECFALRLDWIISGVTLNIPMIATHPNYLTCTEQVSLFLITRWKTPAPPKVHEEQCQWK